MQPERLSQCHSCGKLIDAGARGLCRACSRDFFERDEAPHPFAILEARRQEYEALLRRVFQRELEDEITHEPKKEPHSGICRRCSERGSMAESEFCLQCQIELFHDLDLAAKDIEESLLRAENQHATPMAAGEALEEKRGIAASSRIQPNPPAWKYS